MIAAARDKNRYKSCCLVGNGNCFFLLQRQGTQLLISFSVWSRRRKKIGLEERKKVRKKHWCLWNLNCSIKKMAFLGYQYYAVTDIFTRPQGWIFSGVNILQQNLSTSKFSICSLLLLGPSYVSTWHFCSIFWFACIPFLLPPQCVSQAEGVD